MNAGTEFMPDTWEFRREVTSLFPHKQPNMFPHSLVAPQPIAEASGTCSAPKDAEQKPLISGPFLPNVFKKNPQDLHS